MVMVRSGDPKYLNRIVESKDLSQYTCSIHTSSLGPKQDSGLEGLMVQGFRRLLGIQDKRPLEFGGRFCFNGRFGLWRFRVAEFWGFGA